MIKLIAKIQRNYKLVRNHMLNPIKNAIPNQLNIFNFNDGRNSTGVCLPEISMKLIIAKNGAVKKANMVAIFIRFPISDIKNNNMQIVPAAKKLIQNQYIFLYDLEVSKSKDFVIALGEASKVVMVVLNIVVKAAAAIKIYISSPRFLVYRLINC